MEVLRATTEQYNKLNGYVNGLVVLEFVHTDIGWIVGAGVLDNPDYSHIHDELSELEVIDYNPPQPND